MIFFFTARFVSTKNGSHGIVLVNFTAYSDPNEIGNYINASSLSWKYGQTIAIFELPSLIPPKIVYNGSTFLVTEDSKGDEYLAVSLICSIHYDLLSD